MRALDGIRVIDLTEALAGPYCTMILGDLGADVVKIERPGVGDQSRKWGPPFVGSESAYYLSVNRNKRSVVLDIKSTEGRDQLRRLLETADVFACNLPRAESLRELGLDPESVCARHPRLVYCSITAYGQTGPYAGRTGYDLVAQGESGLMAATGEAGDPPMRWPVAIADLSSGVWSALAILTALLARDRTGRGQFIDQALLEGQLGWAPVMAAQHLATGERPPRLGNRHANIAPYELFRTRDKHMILAVGTEGQWWRLCAVLGLADAVRDDPRFARNADRVRNRAALARLLEEVFEREVAAHWLELLRVAEIPCGPVHALDEALSDPHLRERGLIVDLEHPMGRVKVLGTPLRLRGTPVSYRRRPPLLGEHTEELLREIDLRRRAALRRDAPAGTLGRPPRYAAELALGIVRADGIAPATTLNVSDGGCAIRSAGPPLEVGDHLILDVSAGSSRARVLAKVRWSRPGAGLERHAGLHLVGGALEAWQVLVNDVVRSRGRGAPGGGA